MRNKTKESMGVSCLLKKVLALKAGIVVGVAVLLSCLAGAPPSYGQSVEMWARSWGGSGYEELRAVAVDGNGNVYVVGQTGSFGAGGEDVLLLKYSPSGSLQWQRTWGGSNEEYAGGITLDPSGRFVYIAGFTRSSQTANSDVLLIKFDSNGDLIWAQSWDFGANEVGYQVKVDPTDGNLVVGGHTMSGTNGEDTLLMKVADPGATPPQSPLWAKTWSFSWDPLNSVVMAPGGAIYACGVTMPSGSNGIDFYVARYDSSGNLLWLKTWNRAVNDAATSCTSDAAGNVYVAGFSGEWCGSCPHDAVLLKFDPDGVLQWARTWDTGGLDHAIGVAVGDDGSIYIVGQSNAFDGAQLDVLLLKFDASGTLLSEQIRRGSGDSSALSLVAAGGALFLAGGAINNGGSWQDLTGTTAAGPTNIVQRSVNNVSASGTPTNVVGTVTTPQGQENTGGGGFDAFVAKLIVVPPNQPPVADAGADQTVECTSVSGANVTLNGSASSDPDYDTLSYEWRDADNNVVGAAASVTLALALGDHTFTLTVDDGKGGTASDSVTIHVVDTAPPTLTLTSSSVTLVVPTPSAPGVAVDVLTASGAAANDLCDPTPALSHNGPAVFPIGTTIVTITATDHSGNYAQKQFTVQVVYNFLGFLPPIRSDGSSIFRSGRTIPIKFQLTAADGSFITNATATLVVFRITDAILGVTEEVTPDAAGASNTSNLFRFDPTSNQYIYNLQTTRYPAGTYILRAVLNDGTAHEVMVSIRQ